jgi:O-antigen ligase
MEWGLMALVILIPLPFGAVGAFGRAGLELGALLLALLWLARATFRPTRLPSRLALAGMIGLVLLALVQLVPLGEGTVRLLSPGSARIYDQTTASPEVIEIERRLIETDPLALERPRTLSVDSGATASALRTGIAFFLIFLVAVTVAASRGARGIAAALLLSASFQGLYGILVFASGYNRIWHITKVHYLYAATGTFINKNHFACFLAMALGCGMALIISSRNRSGRRSAGSVLVRLFSAEQSRNLLLCLLLVMGLAGLLLSMSRAGIALGLGALLLTVLIAWNRASYRLRLGIAAIIVLLAAVPLVKLGTGDLTDRYARSAEHWVAEGGRLIVWQDTLAMGASYPLFGSGFGTFSAAYPSYRSSEVRKFYKHAHNDYIQLFAEGGIVGSLLSLMLLASLLISIAHGLTGKKGKLAVGLAAALALFMLHSLIDFNLHIPANAAVAALLAGALHGLPWKNGT